MRDAIAATLIDKKTGAFRYANREDRVDLYETGLGWPLITTTMDGFGIAAPWDQSFGKRKSETLFIALGRISPSWTGFYVKRHDGAHAEVSWSRKFDDGSTLGIQLLDEFTRNPADEGGASFLGLYVAKPDDMILFTCAPAEFFRISLHGELRERVPEELRQRAGAPRSTRPRWTER
jgi:hypothetical protein